jgi:hypothetical protein
MTEEVKTEEVQDESTASITEEDLFSPTPDNEDGEEVLKAEAPAEEPTPEEPVAETAPEEEVTIESLQAQLADKDKQLKDTRDWATSRNQQVQAILKKSEDGEALTAEDIAAIKKNDVTLTDNPMKAIVEQVQKEFPIVASLMPEGEDPEQYVEAFGNMAQHDVALQQELLQTEPSKRTAFVINKGRELSETYSGIKEHGSLLGAYNALKASNDLALEAARKEGFEAGKKETKEKYKDVVSPTKTRIAGGQGDISEGSGADTGAITTADLFGSR